MHLDGVGHLDESVLLRDARRPLLDGIIADFDGATAPSTHEVMVVLARASSVGGFALGGADRVDLSCIHERLQIPVDRRQADPGASVSKQVMQVLGRAKFAEFI